jgi:hypothetical protein
MRSMRRFVAIAAVGFVLGACSSGGEPDGARSVAPASPTPAAPQAAPYEGYPNSILVLGHSGPTGENSDPNQPGVAVQENSWATGSNPDVNSVYLRILSENPKIQGQSFNLAVGGATVQVLLSEAQLAGSLRTPPDLVVIQIMDNDLVCPAKADDYAEFRSGLVRVLETLTSELPNARLFLVSQFGSPGTYAKALTPEERRSMGSMGGAGPCSFIDPEGRAVPKEVARLDEAIHGYEAELEAACEEFAQCRYDDGAFGRIVDKREYYSDDLNHLSIKGHAKAAAVAWEALQRADLVPAP